MNIDLIFLCCYGVMILFVELILHYALVLYRELMQSILSIYVTFLVQRIIIWAYRASFNFV
jgi:hypothetical protein